MNIVVILLYHHKEYDTTSHCKQVFLLFLLLKSCIEHLKHNAVAVGFYLLLKDEFL